MSISLSYPYPYRFCHAQFEKAKTRSCDKVGTKSITTILHFFIPSLITHLLKYWGVKHLFQLNSPIFLKGEL